MKKNRFQNKLRLDRETLRRLEDQPLQAAAGGCDITQTQCPTPLVTNLCTEPELCLNTCTYLC